MESLSMWRALPPGRAGEVILAIDFDATGRPEARFADLAERLGPAYTVWETRPQRDGRPDGDAYVQRWATEILMAGRPVRAVLGFCAGAAFAPSLALLVSNRQPFPVPLILFDPEVVTPDTLYWQYTKIVNIAAPTLTPDETTRAMEAGREARSRSGDLAQLGADVDGALRKHVAVAFERLGLDEERSNELLEAFAAFVEYLCAAGTLDPIPDWKSATAISSSSAASGLNRLRAADPTIGADLVAREVRLDVPHSELLRSSEAADAVRSLLG